MFVCVCVCVCVWWQGQRCTHIEVCGCVSIYATTSEGSWKHRFFRTEDHSQGWDVCEHRNYRIFTLEVTQCLNHVCRCVAHSDQSSTQFHIRFCMDTKHTKAMPVYIFTCCNFPCHVHLVCWRKTRHCCMK